MDAIAYSELLTRFEIVSKNNLEFLTPLNKIEGLFTEEPCQPENLSQNLYDPNDFYIQPKQDNKKKTSNGDFKHKDILVLVGKAEEKKEISMGSEEKKRTYKAGPFALFYEINEGTLDKDAEVWYYKEHKDIVGPVSSYNMDKMVYYHKLEDETRVAFKSIDKFVKFGKIKKIVEQEQQETA